LPGRETKRPEMPWNGIPAMIADQHELRVPSFPMDQKRVRIRRAEETVWRGDHRRHAGMSVPATRALDALDHSSGEQNSDVRGP
jgi:hypothetical protein